MHEAQKHIQQDNRQYHVEQEAQDSSHEAPP